MTVTNESALRLARFYAANWPQRQAGDGVTHIYDDGVVFGLAGDANRHLLCRQVLAKVSGRPFAEARCEDVSVFVVELDTDWMAPDDLNWLPTGGYADHRMDDDHTLEMVLERFCPDSGPADDGQHRHGTVKPE